MNISFAWTTPAVVLGIKTETRRDWKPKTIQLARKAMEAKTPVVAWSKAAYRGGLPFGMIRIVDLIDQEDSSKISGDAFAAEGFEYLSAIGAEFQKGWTALDVWNFWIHSTPGENLQTVVRFELLELNAEGERLRQIELDRGPVELHTLPNGWEEVI